MTKTLTRLRKIKRRLGEKAEDGKITPDQLDTTIENKAGFEKRTKDKYKRILKSRDIIKDQGDHFTLEKPVEETFDEQIDYGADKKHVTVSLNEDAVKAAEKYNLNKSALFNKMLVQKVSSIEDDIKQEAEQFVEDQEDVPFVKDLILEDAYLVSKNEDKRKELYRKHFGAPINSFALDELRKTACTVAENLGILEKPEGVK